MAVILTEPPVAPPCNPWYLESPDMQRYLLAQLLCRINNALGGTTCTVSNFPTYAASWLCQGSPAKIRVEEAQAIIAGLEGIDTAQPVCLTPLQLEGAIAYLIGAVITELNTPQ